MDYFEGGLDVPVCHELFTGVAAVHHKSVDKTLNDGARALLESPGSPLDG